ncbi:hypothetical protein D3C77_669900 [compost metagenome]
MFIHVWRNQGLVLLQLFQLGTQRRQIDGLLFRGILFLRQQLCPQGDDLLHQLLLGLPTGIKVRQLLFDLSALLLQYG